MTEKNNPLEGYDPTAPVKPKPEPEQMKEAVVAVVPATALIKPSAPGWMWILQGIAVLYIIVNTGFLYASISNPAAGYIAAYMIPSTVLLFFFIYTVGELKKIARGEKK